MTTSMPEQRIERLPNGIEINIGHDPDPTPSLAKVTVDRGLMELRTFLESRADLERDQRLSDYGRSERMEPLLAKTASVIANLWNGLDSEEQELAKDEKHFFEVPPIDPKNAGDAIRDREIRDYVRSLSTEEKGGLLQELNQGGHEQVLLALMRSPIPLGFVEKVAAEVWNDTRRASNPGYIERLATAKASVDWGRRGMAHVAGIFMTTTKLSKDALYRAIADDQGNAKGTQAFGIASTHAEQLQREISGKKLMAK